MNTLLVVAKIVGLYAVCIIGGYYIGENVIGPMAFAKEAGAKEQNNVKSK